MLIRSKLLASLLLPLAAGLAVGTAGPAAAQSGLDDYQPVDFTRYQVPDYPGNVYFTTPDGRSCAILYNSGPAGCDAVSMDAPAGTNQLRTSVIEPAHFLAAEEQTFTHPAAQPLPEGHRISLQGTTCGVGYQGTVTCEIGADNVHGFTLAATYSVLH